MADQLADPRAEAAHRPLVRVGAVDALDLREVARVDQQQPERALQREVGRDPGERLPEAGKLGHPLPGRTRPVVHFRHASPIGNSVARV